MGRAVLDWQGRIELRAGRQNSDVPGRWGRPAQALLVLPLFAAACATGPRYAPQPPPAVSHYTGSPEDRAGDVALVQGAAVDPLWWRSFGSPALDRLVAEALARNPDLNAAEETLTATREQLRASRSLLFPTADLSLAAARQRPSPAATGQAPDAYNLFSGGVTVGYAIDLFGLNRHQVGSAAARLAIAGNQLDAARLLIAGNVVQGVFRLASLADQRRAMEKSVADEREVLALVQAQYRLGAVDQSVVLTQQSLLSSSEAGLSTLQQAEDAARHLLATLLGRFPAEGDSLSVPDFSALSLPAELPLALPSALIAARPDIRAAEAALRGANEEVGAAVARLYPQLSIDASYGGAARTPGDAFLSVNRMWDVAGSLLAPLFEGGRLRAEKRAAEAEYRALLAGYRGTVLAAFREVADVLRALAHDDTRLRSLAEASASADQALALAAARYRAGGSDYLAVLASEVQAENARMALIEARAGRYGDAAALYVALGGGDWTTVPLASDPGQQDPGQQNEAAGRPVGEP